MSDMKVYLITSNEGKFLAAKSVFSKFDIKLLKLNGEFPEIQADSSTKIARFTAVATAKEKNIPVIREDHSLFINSLGIPGPYTSFIEKRISAKKLLDLISNQTDRSGYFEISATYAEPNGFNKTYTFRQNIFLAQSRRGNLSGGWNRVIILNGEKRTLAEYAEAERINVWNKNFIKIAKLILKRSRHKSLKAELRMQWRHRQLRKRAEAEKLFL